MFTPYNPRGVYLDPNMSGVSNAFAYASVTDSPQPPLGPRADGGMMYLTHSFPSRVPGGTSSASTTADFTNSQMVGAQSASHKTSESSAATAVGAPVTTTAPVSLVSMMHPPQPPSSISYDISRVGNNTTTPFSRLPAAPPAFSQPSTPLGAAQQQMLQQPFVLHAHSSSQAYTTPSAAVPSPAGRRLMLFSGHAPTTSISPLYQYPGTTAAPAAAMQGGPSHHPPTTTNQLLSPLLTSSSSKGHSGGGNFAYVMEPGSTAPLLTYSVSQSSIVSVASQPWPTTAAAPMLSSSTGTPSMAPRESHLCLDAASVQSPTQRSFATSTAMGSQSHGPASFPGFLHSAPSSMSAARAGGTTAAAGDSPDGMQPAALGVRNFSAPEPVGRCLLPNLPLDPIIPQLALPCPRWGKLPRS
ncbi:hypothetical protein JKF63_00445 [Porcisia hertigi]|uniref:Uncharacterized protein n=1 Tax=Porcisia hertigi TaxID=2761500 RepID=A0A836L126_9TRYP|nr:hypothetical protein JKF63_00445 [Porcisia hertigi]